MDHPLVAGIIPAPLTLAAEPWFFCPAGIVDRNLIPVKETGTAGIALFGEDHPYPYQLRLVGEQLDEASVWNLHKVLVIAPAHLHFLLPERILAKNQRPDPLLDEQLDDPTAGRV